MQEVPTSRLGLKEPRRVNHCEGNGDEGTTARRRKTRRTEMPANFVETLLHLVPLPLRESLVVIVSLASCCRRARRRPPIARRDGRRPRPARRVLVHRLHGRGIAIRALKSRSSVRTVVARVMGEIGPVVVLRWLQNPGVSERSFSRPRKYRPCCAAQPKLRIPGKAENKVSHLPSTTKGKREGNARDTASTSKRGRPARTGTPCETPACFSPQPSSTRPCRTCP